MKVSFLRENITIEYDGNKSVLDIAREQGIELCKGACGMKKCGKCKVLISKGNDHNYDASELELLSEEQRKKGYRLACAAIVEASSTDIVVMTEYDCGGFVSESSLPLNNYNNHGDINIDGELVGVLDVGTTTLELKIYNKKMECMASVNQDNPLRIFGNDVISRIAYATTKDKLIRMQKILIDKCNEMIEKSGCVNVYRVDFLTVIGNPTMLHILTGNDVTPLGKAPFETSYKGNEIVDDLLDIKAYIPPFIKAHLGADAICCLLHPQINQYINDDNKGNYLIMDIGTNSEIFLINDDKVYGCSTPAGPAFEESNITWGLKKSQGAITKIEDDNYYVYIDGDVTKLNKDDENCKMIKGMCASAVIDLLACLLRKGIVDEYGTIVKDYYLSQYNKKVCLTQSDIRSIQLAKSAIMSAVNTLLHEAGIELDQLDKVYLAGNFGNNISENNGMEIGILPKIDEEKFEFKGNMAAYGGAYLGCIDNSNAKNILQYCESVKDKVIHIDLANNDYFKNKYIDTMNF